MALRDYIKCDVCRDKILYDPDGRISDGLKALGLQPLPIRCVKCRIDTKLTFAHREHGKALIECPQRYWTDREE